MSFFRSPERKPNRLSGYNYSSPGYYFITTCTEQLNHYFGEIKNGIMCLNTSGTIVWQQWSWLADQYDYINLDEFIVMPNHVHGILIIVDQQLYKRRDKSHDRDIFSHIRRDKSRLVPTGSGGQPIIPRLVPTHTVCDGIKIKPLSEIIGAFKTTTSKKIHQAGQNDFKWQRSFYDHVIGDDQSLENIRQYIQYNPANWQQDRNNLF